MSLRLQNKEFNFTAKQIKEKVNNIPFVLTADFSNEKSKKNKKHVKAKHLLIIAATIALLYALMTSNVGFSDSTESQFVRNFVEKIGIENIVKGKTYNVYGSSYIERDYLEQYHDTNDYPKDNPHNVLLPTYMP